MKSRIFAVLTVGMLVMSACGSSNSEEDAATTQPTEEADTTEATEAAEVDSTESTTNKFDDPDVLQALNLAVGDCFQSDWEDSFHTDELVDCSEPHDGEVFAIVEPEVKTLSDSYSDVAFPLCTAAYEREMGRRYVDDPGPLMSFVIDGGPKNEPVSGLACLLLTEMDNAFTGSFFTTDTATVFDGYVSTTLIPAGECFDLVDQVNVGRMADCGAGTLVSLGVVDSADEFAGQDFPGVETLRVYRAERCIPLLEDNGIAGNPAEVSGVIPDQLDWNVYDMTLISCDVPWIEG